MAPEVALRLLRKLLLWALIIALVGSLLLVLFRDELARFPDTW